MSEFPLDKFTEPITKLIETISNGIGTLYEPTRIKRRVKADAEAIKIIAKAKVEALAIQDSSLKNYYLVLEQEKLLLEFQKKYNRDNVIILAADELKDKTVSEEEVNKDWITQFIEHSEKASNEEMQVLWAKLLAGEVQKPGSFSKRAMSTLASMSLEEAKAFYKIAILSFKNEIGDAVFPVLHNKYFPDHDDTNERRHNHNILITLNLINGRSGNSNNPLSLLFKPKDNLNHILIFYFNYVIKITYQGDDFKYMSMRGSRFTHIGKELIQLVKPNRDMKGYLRTILTQTMNVSNSSTNNSLKLTAEFGRIKDYDEKNNSFKNSEVIS